MSKEADEFIEAQKKEIAKSLSIPVITKSIYAFIKDLNDFRKELGAEEAKNNLTYRFPEAGIKVTIDCKVEELDK